MQIDLPVLRDVLIRHFEPRKHEDLHTESLMTAKKREDETVSQYFLRLKKLASSLDVENNMLLYAVKRGLPLTYRKHLATKSVDSLQKLFDEATKYERIASFGPSPEERELAHLKSEAKILEALDNLTEKMAKIETKEKGPKNYTPSVNNVKDYPTYSRERSHMLNHPRENFGRQDWRPPRRQYNPPNYRNDFRYDRHRETAPRQANYRNDFRYDRYRETAPRQANFRDDFRYDRNRETGPRQANLRDDSRYDHNRETAPKQVNFREDFRYDRNRETTPKQTHENSNRNRDSEGEKINDKKDEFRLSQPKLNANNREIQCFHCGKFGHSKMNCWKYQQDTAFLQKQNFSKDKQYANVVSKQETEEPNALKYTFRRIDGLSDHTTFNFSKALWENGRSIIVNFVDESLSPEGSGVCRGIRIFADHNRGIDQGEWYNLVGIGPHYDYGSVKPGCLAKSDFTFGNIIHVVLPKAKEGQSEQELRDIFDIVGKAFTTVLNYAKKKGYGQVWIPLNTSLDTNVVAANYQRQEEIENFLGHVNQAIFTAIKIFQSKEQGSKIQICINKEKSLSANGAEFIPVLKKEDQLSKPEKKQENILKPTPRPTNSWNRKNKLITESITKSNPKVIIFGDSIMSNLTRSSVTKSKSWIQANIALAGISGDRVENVLYRIEKTQIPENVSHIYIAVGTNNLFKDKKEEIIESLIECVKTAQKKAPQAIIKVQGLLPRLFISKEKLEEIDIINQELEKYLQDNFVNPDTLLKNENGTINRSCFWKDGLHLSLTGGAILCKFIMKIVKDKTSAHAGFTEPNTMPENTGWTVAFDKEDMVVWATVNNIPVEILVDTGSSVTLVSETLLANLPAVEIVEPGVTQIIGINDTARPVTGAVYLELRMGQYILPIKAHVIETMKHGIVLGRDTFDKHLSHIDYRNTNSTS